MIFIKKYAQTMETININKKIFIGFLILSKVKGLKAGILEIRA